jgi:hypothetical protein
MQGSVLAISLAYPKFGGIKATPVVRELIFEKVHAHILG